MILISVQEEFKDLIKDQILRSAVENTFGLCEVSDSPSLSVRITDDNEIQALNLQYRGFDKPTDVLSFPTDFTDPDLDSRYFGDVVISYPRAEEQSKKRGHPVEAELQLLVVHGVLHLLGNDHAEKREKELMWDLQGKVLERLGLNIQVEDS